MGPEHRRTPHLDELRRREGESCFVVAPDVRHESRRHEGRVSRRFPEGDASPTDISIRSGDFEIGPGVSSIDIPLTTPDNVLIDGTKQFKIEFTLMSGDQLLRGTSAKIYVRDND